MKCNQCDTYKEQLNKYKRKYQIAKSGLTNDERAMLIELICQEQIKHFIPKGEYKTTEYNALENLKTKIRIM